jgi:hypothetical protein
VEIDQEGSESESSGSWTFRWTESDRRVTMRPFYVVHRSGTRVRVEPGDRAFLVDAMDGMIAVDLTKRTRVAELSPGEHVYAVGRLERGPDPEAAGAGYRGAQQGWVMRPPPGEDLLLSSEPLERRFQRKAKAQRLSAWIAALHLLFAGFVFHHYLARVFYGADVVGTVVGRNVDTDDDGNHTYELLVELPGGRRLKLEATLGTYTACEHDGTRVPVRYVPRYEPASVLGRGATASVAVMFSMGLLGLMALWRFLVKQASRAWYERDLVDTGSGRLDESRNKTSM